MNPRLLHGFTFLMFLIGITGEHSDFAVWGVTAIAAAFIETCIYLCKD